MQWDEKVSHINLPQEIRVESLSHRRRHKLAILVVESELGVEPIRVGEVCSDATLQLTFPDRPQPVDIGMVGEEDGIGRRVFEQQHVFHVHPDVDGAVWLDFQCPTADAAVVAIPVWLADEERRRHSGRHELRVNDMCVLPALKLVRGIRARDQGGVGEIDHPRPLRTFVAVGVVERGGGFIVQALLRVHIGHDHAFGRAVPVPERQCERVVPNQLCEDALVEVEEEAVPRQEQPVVVNLQRVLGSRKVELVVAVAAVHVGLVDVRAAVRVGKRAHELVRLLVLCNVCVVEEVSGRTGSHRQLGWELEARGVAARDRGGTTSFGAVTVLEIRSWEGFSFHFYQQ